MSRQKRDKRSKGPVGLFRMTLIVMVASLGAITIYAAFISERFFHKKGLDNKVKIS